MSTTADTPLPVGKGAKSFALFDYGFRPFFLLSGMYALAIAPALAYVILTAGTVLRVFGIAPFPAHYLLSVTLAGLAWMICFGIFVAIYAPILWLPRADGKPG